MYPISVSSGTPGSHADLKCSEEMFDVHGCNPNLVVISDDYKQYDTQDTTTYYGSKAIGITNFRGQPGVRRVLTTRSDGEVRFSFVNGRCDVW